MRSEKPDIFVLGVRFRFSHPTLRHEWQRHEWQRHEWLRSGRGTED